MKICKIKLSLKALLKKNFKNELNYILITFFLWNYYIVSAGIVNI